MKIRTRIFIFMCFLLQGVNLGAAEYEPLNKMIYGNYANSPGDEFGKSVATNGNTAVVGMPGKECTNGEPDCGRAVIYEINSAGDFELKATIRAANEETMDLFGTSVAVSGDAVVIGAPKDNCTVGSANMGGCGAAYVIKKPLNGWEMDMTASIKLTASDKGSNHQLGSSVAIEGDTIVVGAQYSSGTVADSGAVYVYESPNSDWGNMTQTAKLTANNGAENDIFGSSIATSVDSIVVGARGYDCTTSESDCGIVYLFMKLPGGWEDANESAMLYAADAEAGDLFGASVAKSGDTVAVGAYKDDCTAGSDCGSVYVFVKSDQDWSSMTQTAKLTASDTDMHPDYLGYSVSISGEKIVAGASLSDGAIISSGALYFYEKPLAGWSDANETQKMMSPDVSSGSQLGRSVAISGNALIAGAPFDKCADVLPVGDCGAIVVSKTSDILSALPPLIMYLLD